MEINLKTLVLNSHYIPKSIIPLSIITSQEAIKKVLDGDAELISTYNRKILTPSRDDLKWPSIISYKNNYKYSTSVKLNKINLIFRDDFKCQYCYKKLESKESQIDHCFPKSKSKLIENFSCHSWTNVVLSCSYCNSRKKDSLPFGKWKPIRTPFEPTIYDILENRKKYPITIGNEDWLNFLPDWKGPINLIKEY